MISPITAGEKAGNIIIQMYKETGEKQRGGAWYLIQYRQGLRDALQAMYEAGDIPGYDISGFAKVGNDEWEE